MIALTNAMSLNIGGSKGTLAPNLYVNPELSGGGLTIAGGAENPPTSHSIGFNSGDVQSQPIALPLGIFAWHSNFNNGDGRQYLVYDLVVNNPTLPVGIYEFSYRVENTNAASTGTQVFTTPIADNMTTDYINRNMGAFGTTVTVGAILTVTGVIANGNQARVGVGISAISDRACIITSPRLVKVGDI